MSNDIFYIATENYECGNDVNIEVGSQYILIENVDGNLLKLKPVDSTQNMKEVIVPKSIVEFMSEPSGNNVTKNPSENVPIILNRAQSTLVHSSNYHQNRQSYINQSSNSVDNGVDSSSEHDLHGKFSTFGHSLGAHTRAELQKTGDSQALTHAALLTNSVCESPGQNQKQQQDNNSRGVDSNYHSTNQSTEDSTEEILDADLVQEEEEEKEEVKDDFDCQSPAPKVRDKSGMRSTMHAPSAQENVPESEKLDEVWVKHIDENGAEIFINSKSGERWRTTKHTDGRSYFYEETMRISLWNLPGQEKDGEITFGDMAVLPLDEVLENEIENADEKNTPTVKTNEPEKCVKEEEPPATNVAVQEDESHNQTQRFNIRKIKKEDITGPLDNKFMRTEKSGFVEKVKMKVNNRIVSQQKYTKLFMVLTGPELFFYKDPKAKNPKPGLPHGKFDMKLKIQNLEVAESGIDTKSIEKSKSSDKSSKENNQGRVLEVIDKGAPGSSITYNFRFPKSEEMYGWIAALQYAKDWQQQDMYKVSKIFITSDKKLMDVSKQINTKTESEDDVSGDKKNIKALLGKLLGMRPDQSTLEARGIYKSPPVFGSSLDNLCANSKIPEFVYRCIRAIEARGLNHSGIYRISGNQARIQKLRLAVDANTYKLNSDDIEFETLTGALKLFFKELHEPLLDDDFCDKMGDLLANKVKSRKNPYKDINMTAAKNLVHKMKPSHYETAKELFVHLLKVSTFSSQNLMDVSNISMVWGPNLYFTSVDASTKLAVILMTRNQIIDFMVTRCNELFNKSSSSKY